MPLNMPAKSIMAMLILSTTMITYGYSNSSCLANTISERATASDYYLYQNLIRQRKYEQARDELDRMMQNTSVNSPTFPDLVKEAFKIGAFEETIKAGKKLLQVKPKSTELLEIISLAQLLSHRYSDCLETTKELLIIDSNYNNALAIKGMAEIRSGMIWQAKNTIGTASKNTESNLVQLANKTLTAISKNPSSQLPKFDDELASAAGLYQAKDPDMDLLDAGD